MSVLLLKISIHGNNNSRRQWDFMDFVGAWMLHQKSASSTKRPRQNGVMKMVFLISVEMQGLIVRMPAKLSSTTTIVNAVKRTKFLPIRIKVDVNPSGPQMLRVNTTSRHEVRHHFVEDSWNWSGLHWIVGVLVSTAVGKKTRSHLAEFVANPFQ